MKLNHCLSLLIFYILLLLFQGCKNDAIYYQAPNGKIFTAKEYEKAKSSMAKRGKIREQLLKTIVRNDSIIHFFNTTVVEENPYSTLDAFLGKPLPFDYLTDIEGNSVALHTFQGKPTLLNFWFVNCPPCIEEIPHLNALQKQYGNRVNFVAVTFNSPAVVRSFLAKREFNFTHMVNAQNAIDQLHTTYFPFTLYLDKKGVVRSYEGMISPPHQSGSHEVLESLL